MYSSVQCRLDWGKLTSSPCAAASSKVAGVSLLSKNSRQSEMMAHVSFLDMAVVHNSVLVLTLLLRSISRTLLTSTYKLHRLVNSAHSLAANDVTIFTVV